MLKFMDYVLDAFKDASSWSRENSYSSLTATSDALLSFSTPTALSLHVSSLSTPHFATSYSLSTLGIIDGSVAYLYSSLPLAAVPSATASIPLKRLVRGYREVYLPAIPLPSQIQSQAPRQPTLLYGTLALPPPTTLSALYVRQINPRTLLTLSLHSKSVLLPAVASSAPPASLLGHLEHDTGRYRIEALASTDSALVGFKGLWNFGLSAGLAGVDGDGYQSGAIRSALPATTLNSKPSLLSAGAEVYYSPLSSVLGVSTGLRFTTLPNASSAPNLTPKSSLDGKPAAGTSAALSNAGVAASAIPAPSSFPYTITLTLNPLTGSLASTYSIKPTRKLSLSSRFGFNVYSWESEYVIGAEIWRTNRKAFLVGKNFPSASSSWSDGLDWARDKAAMWTTADLHSQDETAERYQHQSSGGATAVSHAERVDRARRTEMDDDKSDESVIKLRIDDNYRFRALWTCRLKELLVTAGVHLAPYRDPASSLTLPSAQQQQWLGSGDDGASDGSGMGINSVGEQKTMWKGGIGLEIAYSS